MLYDFHWQPLKFRSRCQMLIRLDRIHNANIIHVLYIYIIEARLPSTLRAIPPTDAVSHTRFIVSRPAHCCGAFARQSITVVRTQYCNTRGTYVAVPARIMENVNNNYSNYYRPAGVKTRRAYTI